MGRPSTQQIADAIHQSALHGESDAEFDERLGAHKRLSDADLAAMGIVPFRGPTQTPEPAARTSADDPPADQSALAFDLAPTRNRHSGWTAARQRQFIDHLSLTGSVGESAALVGVTSRSAYMLRNRAGAAGFARAWDAALQLAATRLAAIAFDRALHGRTERFYRGGELVMERKVPSDYLLTWLLSRLDPLQFGSPGAKALAAASGDPRETARSGLPDLAAALADIDAADCPAEAAAEIDQRLGEMS